MIPARPFAALLCLGVLPASADQHDGSAVTDEAPQYGDTYRASTLIGTDVHITATDIPAGVPGTSDMTDDWEEIGEIGDLLIGVDGTLDAVVIDVGGFLGLGEKEVSIAWDGLRPVHEPDNLEEWFLGLTMTRAQLEAAPEVERDPAD